MVILSSKQQRRTYIKVRLFDNNAALIPLRCIPEFWDLGHKLFKSTPESFPARFIAADIFELKDLAKQPLASAPELSKVQSFAELSGSVSAIHASSFFHLFNKQQQLCCPLLPGR